MKEGCTKGWHSSQKYNGWGSIISVTKKVFADTESCHRSTLRYHSGYVSDLSEFLLCKVMVECIQFSLGCHDASSHPNLCLA